jgi:hypothetical protein
MTDKDKPFGPKEIAAAEVLLAWHREGKTPLSRIRSPQGDFLVIASPSSSSCLDDWYEEHNEPSIMHSFPPTKVPS